MQHARSSSGFLFVPPTLSLKSWKLVTYWLWWYSNSCCSTFFLFSVTEDRERSAACSFLSAANLSGWNYMQTTSSSLCLCMCVWHLFAVCSPVCPCVTPQVSCLPGRLSCDVHRPSVRSVLIAVSLSAWKFAAVCLPERKKQLQIWFHRSLISPAPICVGEQGR